MKILVINGPNINMLGIREPEIYGSKTYEELEEYTKSVGRELGVEATVFQSNSEGAIIDCIQDAYGKFDGIVINAAAYTHTSIAILDALRAVKIPAVEVHLTEPNEREAFRRTSYVGMACVARFAGLGFEGYRKAMEKLKAFIEEKR